MDRLLDVAKKAAFEAGAFLLDNLGSTVEIGYKGKGHENPFSRIDERAEDIILSTLGAAFPGHSFISEEGGKKGAATEYIWAIDPLDGTVNFLHRHPYFSISIALLHQDQVVTGLVYNPVLNEMFTAVKGKGAYLNDEKIRVSKVETLDKSLVAMSFPYGRKSAIFEQSINHLVCLTRSAQAVRRDGSTALSLSNVACGRYDGFCVTGNELWDYAAGTLIVLEAGGGVTDFEGKSFRVFDGGSGIIATNGKVHELMLKCLKI